MYVIVDKNERQANDMLRLYYMDHLVLCIVINVHGVGTTAVMLAP